MIYLALTVALSKAGIVQNGRQLEQQAFLKASRLEAIEIMVGRGVSFQIKEEDAKRIYDGEFNAVAERIWPQAFTRKRNRDTVTAPAPKPEVVHQENPSDIHIAALEAKVARLEIATNANAQAVNELIKLANILNERLHGVLRSLGAE